MKCPKCNSQMFHGEFCDEDEWIDEDGNVEYYYDAYDYWQCVSCYHRIGDWEDEYVFPDELED